MNKEILIEWLKDENWTVNEKAYILATVDHETMGKFEPVTENLTYKTTDRLCAVFPRRFPTKSSALPYVGKEMQLANYLYGGKHGNNSISDGYKYRGRGLVQITFKENYHKFAKVTGKDLINHPELANQEDVAYYILTYGMFEGTFNGLNMGRYINKDKIDYINCRKVINPDGNLVVDKKTGLTVAQKIAAKAEEYERLFA